MRVLVVDYHTLFREGLVKLLSAQQDISVVGEAADGWEAVIEARRLQPDLVLLDPHMPIGNGLESLRQIRLEAPVTKFLVLTVSEEEDDLLQALKDGAQGYLLKNALPEQLFNAIRDVMQGKTAISPSFAGKLLRELLFRSGGEEEGPRKELTHREKEVLELVGTGASYKEIGSQLGLSAGTVGHHVQSILRKLRLKNRAQAAMFVRNQGLQHSHV
jgi:DNA-binding NarL/FixJ family response regulator